MIANIADTVDPPRPIFGTRTLLDPHHVWPLAIWTVVTVTIARRSIDVPEKHMRQGHEIQLVRFLTHYPQWNAAIDHALHKAGYQIDYTKLNQGET